MYPNCQKIKAFRLFNEGKRPAELFNELQLKRSTIFRYFQLWKKEKVIRKQAAERDKLQRCLRNRIKSCQSQIELIQRFPARYTKGELATWQGAKRRAEQLLQNPSTITDKEKDVFFKYYSGSQSPEQGQLPSSNKEREAPCLRQSVMLPALTCLMGLHLQPNSILPVLLKK